MGSPGPGPNGRFVTAAEPTGDAVVVGVCPGERRRRDPDQGQRPKDHRDDDPQAARGTRDGRLSQRLIRPTPLIVGRSDSLAGVTDTLTPFLGEERRHRAHSPTTTMIVPPPTHMIAPACCWSVIGEIPRTRAGGP